jgi:membrane fusion protein, multidrug efflux system
MKSIKTVASLALVITIQAYDKAPEPLLHPRPALVIKVGDHLAADQGMVLAGEVKSRYESNIGFRIDGKVNKRFVDVGATVKKGQDIVSLDPSDVNLSALAAAADVSAAEANLALAKAELERQRQLHERKFISKSALDISEAEYKTLLAKLKQVKSQYSVSNNQSKYTHLVADRDGVIAEINAEPGQVVSAGQVIAQIVDYNHIEVLVAVPESRMRDMKVGNQVVVMLWADKRKTYEGIIREVSPAASSATRAFDVRVNILNPDEDFKIGMTAGVDFGGVSASNIAIPNTALTEINGVKTIWVISKEGVAMPREVTAGQFTESGVEILSGLKAGETIAIAGVHTLLKGQRVIPQYVQAKRAL